MTEKRDGREKTILDSINEGVFTIDLDWKITTFNRAAERITQVSRREALGQKCCDVFRASICENACVLRRTISSGRPIQNATAHIITRNGERIPIRISTALLKDDAGRPIGGVETFQDLSPIEQLQKELKSRYTFEDIVGHSPAMAKLFEILPQISESSSTVLIEGPSGTGKELFARAIHSLSPRKKAPFIAVNCGALPDTLLESELFGHKAGAFTDARRDKPGRFAVANGGTVFLDEIGDISPAMQIRLLRVLQEREITRVGGEEVLHVDVRVIAATNKDLLEEIGKGRFRDDLYYRLNVVTLKVPPLRSRREDIPLLIDYFLKKTQNLGLGRKYVSPEARKLLLNHSWKGNVRELENVFKRAAALTSSDTILPEDLPLDQEGTGVDLSKSIEDIFEERFKDFVYKMCALEKGDLYDMLIRRVEKSLIKMVMEETSGKQTRAADILGINRNTLRKKITELHIPVKKR